MKFKLLLTLLVLSGGNIIAQQKDSTDLMSILQKESQNDLEKIYTTATFKTTRIINGHSIENTGAGVLDVKIAHRFGSVKDGWSSFFGLDFADTRIGLDYGINKWLMVGGGRSSAYGTFDGFFKAKLLRQSKGHNSSPIAISVMADVAVNTISWYNRIDDDTLRSEFNNRLSYTLQLLLARKFSEGLSLQLTPTFIHFNLAPPIPDKDPPLFYDGAHTNIIAIGFGGRQKISKRASLNFEYYYQVPGHKLEWSENCFSVGIDIETGGHVFQFMLSNSNLIAEPLFIPQTTDKWSKGQFHIGFNISRVFTVAHPKS